MPNDNTTPWTRKDNELSPGWAGEVIQVNTLVPDKYDYISLTYVSSGNGIGEIETATFKDGGAAGTTVAVLTLAYDADNKLSSVTKS